MTMNERLRFLRKSVLEITQEEFAKRIDVSTSNIGGLEIGRTKLTDRVIKSICAIFGVNEDWLRNGNGKPILDSEKYILYQLKEYFELEDMDIDIVMRYVHLPLQYRARFRDYIRLMVDHETNSYMTEIELRLADMADTPDSLVDDKAEFLAKNAAMASKQYDEEKRQESQVSSAKESGAG